VTRRDAPSSELKPVPDRVKDVGERSEKGVKMSVTWKANLGGVQERTC
jgi:hypothetical protein